MKNNSSKVFNFGKGWIIIIIGILMFYFYGGMTTDGTNLSVPAAAERIGISTGEMQIYHSFAAMFGVVINIAMAFVIKKIGAARTAGICLIYGAVAYYLMPRVATVPLYMICAAFMWSGMATAAFTCGGILVNRYFPKTKGVVMGYTTMGLNINSACFIAIVSMIQASTGKDFAGAIVPICIATAVLGLVVMFFIKDDPKEIGFIPDNVSKEQYEKEYDPGAADSDYDGGWTTKSLLSTPYFWLVAVISGLFNIATGVLIANMVARNIEMGMTPEAAVGLMTVVAVIGIFGSWAVGIIDDKIGTKKTMIYFGVFYFAAGALNCLSSVIGSMIPLYISIVMIGIGIGGSANFTSSLPTSVFGRKGFDKVNSILFPVQGVINCSCFLVSGMIRIITADKLMWIYLAGGIVSLLAAVITVLLKDEHKYNSDWK